MKLLFFGLFVTNAILLMHAWRVHDYLKSIDNHLNEIRRGIG